MVRRSVLALVVSVALLGPSAARASEHGPGCSGFAPRDALCRRTVRLIADVYGLSIGFGSYVGVLDAIVRDEDGDAYTARCVAVPVYGQCNFTLDGQFRRGETVTFEVIAAGAGSYAFTLTYAPW